MVKKKTILAARKKPIQQRSSELVRDIVKGAIRVLKKEGGRRFTTIRVAEEAGISVGSLYQYFPNKESILFQVQQQEWEETTGILLAMIADQRYTPMVRLRKTIALFFDSEWEEASLRKALAETGTNLESTKQYSEMVATVISKLSDFLAEAVPDMAPERRRFMSEFVLKTMTSLGEEITNKDRSRREVRKWASNYGDMIWLFLTKGQDSEQSVADDER